MAKRIKNGVNVDPYERMRRQLGAANARERRHQQRIGELEAENAKLSAAGGKYLALFEEASRLCRDWCLLCCLAASGREPDKVAQRIDELTDRMESLGMLKTGGVQ